MMAEQLKEYVLLKHELNMLPVRVMDMRLKVHTLYNCCFGNILFPVTVVS